MFTNTNMEHSYNQELRDAELYDFLINAPKKFRDNERIKKFQMKNGDFIHCILWNYHFYISGTDIVKILIYRFQLEGRQIANLKKFEEGIFSDLRNLKPGIDATLEGPRSDFLEFLYKNGCIRTQKKQKVFYWYSVPHDALFCDGLERDVRRENQVFAYNNFVQSNHQHIMHHRSISPPANHAMHHQTPQHIQNPQIISKKSLSNYQKQRRSSITGLAAKNYDIGSSSKEINNLRTTLFSDSPSPGQNLFMVNEFNHMDTKRSSDILKKTLFDDETPNIISNYVRPSNTSRRSSLIFSGESEPNNNFRQRSSSAAPSRNALDHISDFGFINDSYLPEFDKKICQIKSVQNAIDEVKESFDRNGKVQFVQKSHNAKE